MAFTNHVTETVAENSSLASPYEVTLAVPDGLSNGDIMFTHISNQHTTAKTVTTNAAWTFLAGYTAATDKHYLFYRIASSEPASYVWTFSGTCRYRCVCTGYSQGDFDVASIDDIVISNTAYRNNDTLSRAAGISTAADNSPMVFFGSCYSTATRTQTAPAAINGVSWAEDYDAGSTTPDLWLAIYSMVNPTAGATGDMDATFNANTIQKFACAVALKPAAGGVSRTPTIGTQVLAGIAGRMGLGMTIPTEVNIA